MEEEPQSKNKRKFEGTQKEKKRKKSKLDSDKLVEAVKESKKKQDIEKNQNEKGNEKTFTNTSIKESIGQNTETQGKVDNPANRELFSNLEVDETIKQALKDMGFQTMTPIQAQCIPHSLQGKDILASARTGSGKTLAFLIPSLQFLINAGFKKNHGGTGVLIITPTRELAIQIFGVATDLFKHNPDLSLGIVLGGMNKEPEEAKLREGVNLLIATPGRLIDHLRYTKGFKYKNLRCLVIDEADRMLDQGFEAEMKEIITLIPKERQTMLFSATQTNKVQDLAKVSLTDPHEVHVDLNRGVATAEGLEQFKGYVICAEDVRFRLLYTFLKKNSNKKIIVFLSSCASVTYHVELLNHINLSVLSLHGKQKQAKRARTFFEFNNLQSGILLCTDVAARGLDIPRVDWIIQYDPPNDPKEYIHRVGRTARGIGGVGKGLLFLLPCEKKFLQYLNEIKVPLEEYEFPANKIANIQLQLENLVETIYYLNQSARAAYKSYLAAYINHSQRDVFDVSKLDLKKTALSFGLTNPPVVDLAIKPRDQPSVQSSSRYKQNQGESTHLSWREKKKASTGHFSADNPYGKRDANDKRAFQR